MSDLTLADINNAIQTLHDKGYHYAEAKAHRVYLEEMRKSQKAMLMKAAIADGRAKTSASAEMEAYADPAYVELLGALQTATEIEESMRWVLISCQAKIDVWRSMEASNRAMDRAVM